MNDTSPPLEIPHSAVTATYASPYTEAATNKVIRSVLELGAPIVVAAELRRLAGVFIAAEGRGEAAVLLGRADELDPQDVAA